MGLFGKKQYKKDKHGITIFLRDNKPINIRINKPTKRKKK